MLVLVGLVLVAALAWSILRPASIATDFQGWRQADTQTIAQRFTEPGASLLKPAIAWGGDGPGYVESELQLYPWLVSRCFSGQGFAEWPGQTLSLGFAVLAAWVTFSGLSRRWGGAAACLGVVGFLSTRGVVHAATSVQPEALCLLLYVTAWFALERYLEGGRSADLLLYGAAGGLAMLVKPTAAHLGISSFLLVAWRYRRELRSPKIWLAWGWMVGVLGLHLLHARDLYLMTGNTFGVLSGGDSKLPHLAQLIDVRLLFKALKYWVLWGAGVGGALALLGLLVVKRSSAAIVCLLVGNLVWTFMTLRYSSQSMGAHYSVLGALLGASAVAELSSLLVQKQRRGLLAAFALVPVLTLAASFWQRRSDRWLAYAERPVAEAGQLLARHAARGSLVVVRSSEPAFDIFWRVHNNFEDPRVMYLSGTRGFLVAADDASLVTLKSAAAKGARYYVEPDPLVTGGAATDHWLGQNAELVARTPVGGRLFRLKPN